MITVLLIFGFLVGSGGLFLYNNRFTKKISSISEDQIIDDGKTKDNSQMNINFEQIDDDFLEALNDPFFSTPCYLKTDNPCVLVYKKADEFGFFSFQRDSNFILSKENLQYGMGRILGKPDSLKILFRQQVRTNKYVTFVRTLEEVSLKKKINPEVIYSLIDYSVGKQLSIGIELQLPSAEGVIFTLEDELKEASLSEDQKNFSIEGNSLLETSSLYFPNRNLLQEMYKETGAFDEYYRYRIQSLFVDKPFIPRWSEMEVVEDAYYRGDFSAEIAICHEWKAYLCSAPQENPIEDISFSPCFLASFLNEFCDGTLLSL